VFILECLARELPRALNFQEISKMPKLKTKSGAKKRFKLTGRGKVRSAQAGKQHGMIKRTNKFIRNARGTTILSSSDARIVKQFLPYA
jgi:large subunit ribosomal protein L35